MEVALLVCCVLCYGQAFVVDRGLDPAQPQASSQRDESAGWRTWAAAKDWFRPVADYFRHTLPDKTPQEVASDVSDVVSDTYHQVNNHDVVQGVKDTLRPVGNWLTDAAQDISQTKIRDIYNSAADGVRRADASIGDWLSPDATNTLHRR